MANGTGTPAPPANWYPDPADPRQLRYWDGVGWTSQLTANPTGGGDWDSPAGYVPMAQFAAFSGGGTALTPVGDQPNTVPAWAYALLPLVLLPLLLFPLSLSLDDVPALLDDIPVLAIRSVFILAFVVLAFSLAAADGRLLRARGSYGSVPAILAIAPPIYTVARIVVTGAKGIPVAVVSLLLQAAVAFALLTQPFPSVAVPPSSAAAAISSEGMLPPFSDEESAYLLTPEGMAQKILFDSQTTSSLYTSVSCEPLPSSETGAVTTCVTTGKFADFDLTVQVIPDAQGVPFTVTQLAPSLHRVQHE